MWVFNPALLRKLRLQQIQAAKDPKAVLKEKADKVCQKAVAAKEQAVGQGGFVQPQRDAKKRAAAEAKMQPRKWRRQRGMPRDSDVKWLLLSGPVQGHQP